jgi:hypothetical protein
MLIFDQVEATRKSRMMKEANAEKAGLRGVEREIYLAGKARLKNVGKVAQNANGGAGWKIVKV